MVELLLVVVEDGLDCGEGVGVVEVGWGEFFVDECEGAFGLLLGVGVVVGGEGCECVSGGDGAGSVVWLGVGVGVLGDGVGELFEGVGVLSESE